MTFFALLTNEMRLRLRRERTIWIIVTYIVLMGLFGWLSLMANNNSQVSYANTPGGTPGDIGLSLYGLLSVVQLFLILFITPSFTATAVNGEKEHQTYDMLLCSKLSAFSLVTGKLIAGLINALLLIAASIPLFSLVFFFGGVSPVQVLSTLTVFIATTLLMGCFGLFCSTIFKRPAVSTAITYLAGLLWLLFPLLISGILFSGGSWRYLQMYPNKVRLLFLWNPLTALLNTYPSGNNAFSPLPYYFGLGYYSYNNYGPGTPGILFMLGNWGMMAWQAYCLISIGVAILFFLLALVGARPNLRWRFHRKQKKLLA